MEHDTNDLLNTIKQLTFERDKERLRWNAVTTAVTTAQDAINRSTDAQKELVTERQNKSDLVVITQAQKRASNAQSIATNLQRHVIDVIMLHMDR